MHKKAWWRSLKSLGCLMRLISFDLQSKKVFFFSKSLVVWCYSFSLIPFADSFYHTRHHLIAHWSTRMAELNLEVLTLNHNVCYQTPLILFICLTWMSAEAWVSLAFLTSLPLMKRIRSIFSRRPSCSVVEPSWMSEIQKKRIQKVTFNMISFVIWDNLYVTRDKFR